MCNVSSESIQSARPFEVNVLDDGRASYQYRGMQIRVAVIGAGYWGPNLIPNYAAEDGCALAAVCDLNPERLKSVEDQYHVRTTTRLEDVLSDSGFDAIA